MSKQKKSPEQMSFLDHLEELRWHLIKSTLAVVIGGIVAFLLKGFIFDTIIFGPKRPDFWTYRMLCNLSTKLGFDESFCLEELPFIIQSRKVAEQFSAHIWVSITAGFIIAFPYILYQFWQFVKPALYENERKNARGFIFTSSALFFLGVFFGYYVITPLSINFLGNYVASTQIKNEFDLSSYIGLVRASVLACGLVFELPIVIYFLARVGIVTPQILKDYRKFALVGVLILSAVITPPDIASQIIVSIPILILYEISIIIAKIVQKNNVTNDPKYPLV